MTFSFRLFFAIATTLALSCRDSSEANSTFVGPQVLADSLPGSCPFLTTDTKNNLVLSWIRQYDSTKAVFCYAVSADGGQSFSTPVEIPATANIHPHSENLPKILFKPSGEVLVAWGERSRSAKNPYAGLVLYAQSLDGGKSWGAARRLVADTAAVDQRYFDLALMPDGEAAIIWLDSRKPGTEEGSSLYFAKTKGENGFQNEKRISGPCCECCRTDLFIDKKQNIHVLYRAILNDTIRDMVHAVSTDEGNTFSAPRKISNDNWVIDGCPHTGPAMAESDKGLYFTWFTAGGGTGVFYNQSIDNGVTFTAKTGLSGNTGRHPQLTRLPNGAMGIVWDESLKSGAGFVSKIGFKVAGDTAVEERLYLNSDSTSATFPVITTWQKNVLVAYTANKNNRNYVFYQRIAM